jgi:hypothetical protein
MLRNKSPFESLEVHGLSFQPLHQATMTPVSISPCWVARQKIEPETLPKADDDLHFALQGLDYWVRIRWRHLQNPDNVTGLGESQQYGYFGGSRLSAEAPRLCLIALALGIDPATEAVLRYLSPRAQWTLAALEDPGVKVVGGNLVGPV